MPNRILRETILDSQAVNNLTAPAEVFYRRLMSVVDDFGRFDARPAVLKARCYPLKLDGVREADISRWIAECEKAGLIVLYSHEDKPYMLFLKLGEPRAKTSKFPAPPADVCARAQTLSSANTCAHTRPYSYSDTPTDSREKDAGEPPKAQPPPTERETMIASWVRDFLLDYRGPALERDRLHLDCRNAFSEIFDKVKDRPAVALAIRARTKTLWVHQFAADFLKARGIDASGNDRDVRRSGEGQRGKVRSSGGAYDNLPDLGKTPGAANDAPAG